MRKVLTALATAGTIAAAALATASTADAQWGWRDGWHVGGDYYQPTDYGYGSAPLYNYSSALPYNNSSAPLYNYGTVPTYGAPAIVAPMPTVETIETVRTIRPVARSTARREIVTRQTTIRSFATNTYSQSLYNYAGSPAVVSAPAYDHPSYYDYGTSYAPALYNTAAMPTTAAVAAPVITAPAYRYVYEWNRILVIDPSTNIVVQALPR